MHACMHVTSPVINLVKFNMRKKNNASQSSVHLVQLQPIPKTIPLASSHYPQCFRRIATPRPRRRAGGGDNDGCLRNFSPETTCDETPATTTPSLHRSPPVGRAFPCMRIINCRRCFTSPKIKSEKLSLSQFREAGKARAAASVCQSVRGRAGVDVLTIDGTAATHSLTCLTNRLPPSSEAE